MPAPLSPTALIRVSGLLRPLLGPPDQTRLDTLRHLIGMDGRINLGDAARTLFPGKSPKDQLTFLRQFRDRVNAAARDGGMVLEFRQDGRTKAPAEERQIFFTGDDLAARGAEGLTEERTADIQARIDSGELRLDQAAIPAGMIEVPVVISYGREDSALMLDLRDRLLAVMRRDTRHRFTIWLDERLLVGKPFDPAIQARFRHCHLGLLMLSPDFAGSDYIRDLELPHFTLGDALGGGERHPVPIMLRHCDFARYPHLKRLRASLQFFKGKRGSYERCVDAAARDAFAEQLFAKIQALLAEHPPLPSGAQRHDPVLAADLDQRMADQRLPKFAPTRGRRGNIASAPDSDSQAEDALGFLHGWLGDPQGQPYAALLGEYGLGKTTTCRVLARQLLDVRQEDPTAPLPIYLDLRDLDRASRESGSLDRILEKLLERANRQQSGHPLTPAELRRLVQEDGALLIIDGLDEALTHLPPSDGNLFTRQLLECLPLHLARNRPANRPGRAGRLLVTCRTHFFPTLRAQASHLTVQGREGLHTEDFRALTLLPFNEDQIRDYLAAALPGRDADAVLALFSSIHNLSEMAERPVTLALLTQRIDRVEALRAERGELTGAELYRELILSWMDRDDGKHQLTPAHKQLLMEQVAAKLWQERRSGWTAEESENWLVTALRERPDIADHYEGVRRDLLKLDLRNATCLVRNGDEFRFAHTSLQEYFLAAHLLRALREARPEAWIMPVPSRETLDFLGQMLRRDDAARAGLAALRDCYRPGASELLLRYALHALAEGHPCIPLAGIQLEGADLSGLRFEGPGVIDLTRACFRGARLREAVLIRMRLDGADFAEADLARAEFNQCSLRNAVLTDAKLEGALFPGSSLVGAALAGVRWGRTRLFNNVAPVQPPAAFALGMTEAAGRGVKWLSGHTDGVTSVCFSPDGARLASGSDDGTLCLWDVESGAPLATLEGHTQQVTSVCFSPDGARLASASRDNTVRLWNAVSGMPLAKLEGHTDWVRLVCFSPDGARLASGSDDGTIRLWDAASGAPVAVISGHTGWVRSVCFSPGGARLASGSDDGTLRLWDAASGKLLAFLEGHADDVYSVCFSPDGARLASGSDDRTLRLWDAASGALLAALKGHGSWVRSVCFSPDGARLASGSYDRTLRLWDAASGAPLATLEGHTASVTSVCFSPDGTRLASGSDDNTLRLWDAASGAQLATLKGHTNEVYSVCFSPDGARLASGSRDNTVRLWDAATGVSRASLKRHTDRIRLVCFSPDSARLASGSHDGTLRLWDVESGAPLATLEGHANAVTSVCFSPDGARLASGSDDRTLCLWDAASGALIATLEGHTRGVRSLWFSPDGARLASGSDDCSLRLWDGASGTPLATLKGHTETVTSVCFSPDGARFASGSHHGILRLWDVESGAPLAKLEGHNGDVTSVCFSPDGARLASGSHDGTLRLWDVESGAPLAKLEGHKGEVTSVCFSPDGARLASGSGDRTLRLWDAASGAPLATLGGHRGGVTAVCFSPDGALLASGSDDGTLRLWDVARGAPLRHVRIAGPAWAWFDAQDRLLRHGGEAWRHLQWHDHDAEGRLETWPFECFRDPSAT